MRKERVYLEHPIYRYSVSNGKVLVEAYVKRIEPSKVYVYTEDETKNISIRDKEFNVILKTKWSMLSYENDKVDYYKKLLREYLAWHKQELIEIHENAIKNIDKTLEVL